MYNRALIVGYGSIGKKHAEILKKKLKIKNITICTKQKLNKFKTIKTLSAAETKASYIIISSVSSEHFKHLKFIEKNFQNSIILVEKPLFDKYRKINISKNKVFVGYNLRFHPVIEYIHKKIKKEKIIDIKVLCNSFLPNWRTNQHYKKSSSAFKKSGGGVILDLSHEIDLIRWMFGEIKIDFVKKGKFSKLSIQTEDLLKLNGKVKKANLSIDLNYYSRIKKRNIFIDTENLSIFGDLINNKVEIKSKNENLVKRFSNYHINESYIKQHKLILTKKSKKVCNFKFGLETMKQIEKIKKWKTY